MDFMIFLLIRDYVMKLRDIWEPLVRGNPFYVWQPCVITRIHPSPRQIIKKNIIQNVNTERKGYTIFIEDLTKYLNK